MSPAVVGPEELQAKLGSHLGFSGWHTLRQEQVDLFAEATGDRQWIHVDPELAKSGPFGTTVAHGYLTLALLPALLEEIVEVKGPGSSSTTGSTASGSLRRYRSARGSGWAPPSARSKPSTGAIRSR